MYKKLTLIIFLFIVETSVAMAIEQRRLITDSINQISFDIEEGNLILQGTINDNVEVLAQFQDQSCQDDLEVEQQELKLTNKKKKAGCKCDYIINLPKNIDIAIKSGTSNIEINGMASSLTVENGSGNITGDSILEKALLEVGSGNVSLTVNKNSSSIKIGSGNGVITFPVIPQNKVNLEVMIGSGNAQINIPENAEAEYDIRSMNNYNRSTVDSANFKIDLMVGTGNVSVGKI